MGSQQGDIKMDSGNGPSADVKTDDINLNSEGPKPQRAQGGPNKRRHRGGGPNRWQGGNNSISSGGGGGGGGMGNRNVGGNNTEHKTNFNDSNNAGNQNQDHDNSNKRGNMNSTGGGGGRGFGNRFGSGNMGGGGGGGGGGNRDREFERINERVMMINGPTLDLPPLDSSEKKFAGRNRLYVGNLSNDTTEDEITELFKPFGETSELFLNKEKMFAFIRMDYHCNAERAKRELDGQMRKGRQLKIRFAPNNSVVRVKNLTPFVTNELLYTAFSVFGDIERCVVIVDERGKSTGEGVVEFARKPAALCAIRRCSENCYFLTSSLRPVVVEPFEIVDDIDGFTEKGSTAKRSNDWYKAREVGPRFANPNSFEHQYGRRWKELSDMYKQKLEALKREQQMEEEKLEAQMEYARYDHETEMLREQLRARELDKERQKREWEIKQRQADEERQRGEEQMRRMEEEMMMRMNRQEEEMRLRQEENNLFLKAHQLNDMLDQQERYDTTVVSGNDNMSGLPPDPKAFMDSYDRNERMGGGGGGGGGGYDNDMRGGGGGGGGNRGGNWSNIGGRRDDGGYQNKRRRY